MGSPACVSLKACSNPRGETPLGFGSCDEGRHSLALQTKPAYTDCPNLYDRLLPSSDPTSVLLPLHQRWRKSTLSQYGSLQQAAFQEPGGEMLRQLIDLARWGQRPGPTAGRQGAE